MEETSSAAAKAKEQLAYQESIEQAILKIKEGTYKNEMDHDNSNTRTWTNTEDDINAFRKEKMMNIDEETKDYERIFKDLNAEIENAKRKAAKRNARAKAKREKANAAADAGIDAAKEDQERHNKATEEENVNSDL